jgi:hypothetical protein
VRIVADWLGHHPEASGRRTRGGDRGPGVRVKAALPGKADGPQGRIPP